MMYVHGARKHEGSPVDAIPRMGFDTQDGKDGRMEGKGGAIRGRRGTASMVA